MKRQRGNLLGNTNKKKAKRGVEKQSEEVKTEAEERNRNDSEKSVVAEPAELIAECDYWINNEWLCLWSSDNMVDEQMSWGTCWSPVWDMEFIGEAYINLYNDVLWDDDIWDLKAIKEVPSP
ncbi:uncharacterized protein [Nicotiana tomentosiformis]|uniref:uncharacterized protein n=1 Tax=Nicotiana tomentosiformis TaxID=4098 RepID=UPI00051C169A|nr:uncharacterized protein LOC104102156 [Nicotiana tomentosiformis]